MDRGHNQKQLPKSGCKGELSGSNIYAVSLQPNFQQVHISQRSSDRSDVPNSQVQSLVLSKPRIEQTVEDHGQAGIQRPEHTGSPQSNGNSGLNVAQQQQQKLYQGRHLYGSQCTSNEQSIGALQSKAVGTSHLADSHNEYDKMLRPQTIVGVTLGLESDFDVVRSVIKSIVAEHGPLLPDPSRATEVAEYVRQCETRALKQKGSLNVVHTEQAQAASSSFAQGRVAPNLGEMSASQLPQSADDKQPTNSASALGERLDIASAMQGTWDRIPSQQQQQQEEKPDDPPNQFAQLQLEVQSQANVAGQLGQQQRQQLTAAKHSQKHEAPRLQCNTTEAASYTQPSQGVVQSKGNSSASQHQQHQKQKQWQQQHQQHSQPSIDTYMPQSQSNVTASRHQQSQSHQMGSRVQSSNQPSSSQPVPARSTQEVSSAHLSSKGHQTSQANTAPRSAASQGSDDASAWQTVRRGPQGKQRAPVEEGPSSKPVRKTQSHQALDSQQNAPEKMQPRATSISKNLDQMPSELVGKQHGDYSHRSKQLANGKMEQRKGHEVQGQEGSVHASASLDTSGAQQINESSTLHDVDSPPLASQELAQPPSPVPEEVQRQALQRLLQTVDVFDHSVPEWVFEEPITPKGIENKGQICYIISAMQSMMDVAPGLYRAIFRAHFLLQDAQEVVKVHKIKADETEAQKKDGDAGNGLALLLAHVPMLEVYFDPNVNVVSADKLQQLGRVVLGKHFIMGQQEDTVEFVNNYLSKLNLELKTLQLAAKRSLLRDIVAATEVVEDTWHVPGKKGKRSSVLEGQERIQQQNTTVADAVWGVTQYSEYRSSKGASRVSQLQMYYALMLPLGERSGGKAGGGTIQGLLHNHFTQQNHGGNELQEEKLGHAPKVLNVQLLRFTYSGNKQKKLNDVIDISREVKVPFQQQIIHYALRSIIMHQSDSVDYGHYYLTIPLDSSVKVFDDQIISDKPRSSSKGDAYLITYVRCE